jgi:hypothetical protein
VIDWEQAQRALCKRLAAEFAPAPASAKLSVARAVGFGVEPLNGLRRPLTLGTTGWYVWAGEHLSSEADFFEPLHVAHLKGRCPAILKYLGLPPGRRFLVAGDYEDLGFDPSLLDV